MLGSICLAAEKAGFTLLHPRRGGGAERAIRFGEAVALGVGEGGDGGEGELVAAVGAARRGRKVVDEAEKFGMGKGGGGDDEREGGEGHGEL